MRRRPPCSPQPTRAAATLRPSARFPSPPTSRSTTSSASRSPPRPIATSSTSGAPSAHPRIRPLLPPASRSPRTPPSAARPSRSRPRRPRPRPRSPGPARRCPPSRARPGPQLRRGRPPCRLRWACPRCGAATPGPSYRAIDWRCGTFRTPHYLHPASTCPRAFDELIIFPREQRSSRDLYGEPQPPLLAAAGGSRCFEAHTATMPCTYPYAFQRAVATPLFLRVRVRVR
mmetsp:Transcript_25791/g.53320  ORF Transcript_25791/g.53320 Transcript_25791/m.53320 type:complete len:230 (+) Transcript_25791:652-1341(+)